MKLSSVFLGGLLFSIGCGDVGIETEPTSDTDRAQLTGGTSAPGVAPYTSVVKFRLTLTSGGTSTCSGLKVADNVYWTAGHCGDNAIAGAPIVITNNANGSFTSGTFYSRTIQTVAVHPSFKNFVNTLLLTHPDGTGLNLAHYDVAQFTLNATTPAIPSYSTTDSVWVEPNQAVQFAGYGNDDVFPAGSGTKRFGNFNLVDLPTLRNGSELDVDFYAHATAALGTPCAGEGDSGAPMFKSFNGTLKLIGITFRGSSTVTGWARYSNVRKWMASPSSNTWTTGDRGFIFNHYTGRCLSRSISGGEFESDCDGRNQDFDFQSWRLAPSGINGTFYVINGLSGKCLDLNTTLPGSTVVERTCLPTTQAGHTQRWNFFSTRQANYRRMQNFVTGACATPTSPDSSSPSVLVSQPCVTTEPGWRHQAWMMTR